MGLPVHATTACDHASCASGIPGYGVALAGASAHRYLDAPATAARRRRGRDPRLPACPREHRRVHRRLLRATAARPARFNCFGLHEWAMVYRVADGASRTACRCGSAPRVPTRWSNQCRCAAATSTPTGSSPSRRRRGTPSTLTRRAQAGRGAAGVRARRRWTVQVGVQAGAAGRIRAGRWTASSWPQTPGCWTCGPAPTTCAGYGFEPIAVETPGGSRGVRHGPSRRSAERAAPLRAAIAERCHGAGGTPPPGE